MHTTRPWFDEDDFHKSSFSNPNQDCVEVARGVECVAVRDSKIRFRSTSDNHLILGTSAFDAFVSTLIDP